MKSRALLLTAALFAGCAAPSDDLERAALEASAQGSLANYHHGGRGSAGIEAAGRVTARFYWVAKYAATPVQREAAAAHGRAIVKKITNRRAPVKSRYIAVTTKRDSRSKTATSVMIFDTQSDSIVGNSVYDLNERPPDGQAVRFETYSASYFGTQ